MWRSTSVTTPWIPAECYSSVTYRVIRIIIVREHNLRTKLFPTLEIDTRLRCTRERVTRNDVPPEGFWRFPSSPPPGGDEKTRPFRRILSLNKTILSTKISIKYVRRRNAVIVEFAVILQTRCHLDEIEMKRTWFGFLFTNLDVLRLLRVMCDYRRSATSKGRLLSSPANSQFFKIFSGS